MNAESIIKEHVNACSPLIFFAAAYTCFQLFLFLLLPPPFFNWMSCHFMRLTLYLLLCFMHDKFKWHLFRLWCLHRVNYLYCLWFFFCWGEMKRKWWKKRLILEQKQRSIFILRYNLCTFLHTHTSRIHFTLFSSSSCKPYLISHYQITADEKRP